MLRLSNDYAEASQFLREAVRDAAWGRVIEGAGYGFLGAQQAPQAAAAIEHHLPVRTIETPSLDLWSWQKWPQAWGAWQATAPWSDSGSDYQVYVPFINRSDLLCSALDSLIEHAKNVIVIDQSLEGAPEHRIFSEGALLYRIEHRIQFTQMMNWCQLDASYRNKRFNVFMHNDAVAVDDALSKALAMARSINYLGVMFTNYDALAVFSTEACADVGFWDETFRWYSADNDYYRRLRLRGWKTADSGIKVEHLEQQTSKSDPNIFAEARHRQAQAHYIEKWGGNFGDEKFDIPYDGKSCSLLLELNSPFGMA